MPDQAPRHLHFIYKHSPACGRSLRVIEKVRDFAAANPDVPIVQVDVLAERPRSQQLEDDLGIQHESPQAILMLDGKPVWHASHWAVTREAMEQALQRATGAP
jgi:bacillithiol system protein YtxJ